MQKWGPGHCVLHVGDCWSSKAWQDNTWTAAGRRLPCGFPTTETWGFLLCWDFTSTAHSSSKRWKEKHSMQQKNQLIFMHENVENMWGIWVCLWEGIVVLLLQHHVCNSFSLIKWVKICLCLLSACPCITKCFWKLNISYVCLQKRKN